MPDSIDADRSEQMEDRLEDLQEHIDDAEEKRDGIASKAQRAGDAIEGGPDHGGAEDTLSGGGSSDEAGDDAGDKPSDSANGEVEEEQANPT